eukprot:TRINITY_DN3543_c0_g3_i1.p1 TRINITY_DN3543_c0_g3~~TRINITY_DN3543_c0_g3_i1.p1  ORF type:complete len:696 (+),score=139.57 TRINITY_DN3543_c0_g3_i1:106-2193(+)
MGNSSSVVKGRKGVKVEQPPASSPGPTLPSTPPPSSPDPDQKPEENHTRRPSNSQASKESVENNQPESPKKQIIDSGKEDIRDKYELGDVLGSGSFGQVLEVRVKSFPDKVRAVKIIERDEQEEEESDYSVSALFRKEVGLLQTFEHPNIVRFWDFYVDTEFLYVVMDLCRGGEVFDMVIALKRFTEADAAVIGAQMLGAIDYIHRLHVMHRDIKAENFLLSEKSPTAMVKMIDFGMAVKFNPGQQFHDLCGSPHYLAPELVGQKYNHMVDMWAFGVLMYLMLYGHYPFDADTTKAIMVKIITGTIRWNTQAKLSDKTVRFLQRVLISKPKKRVSAELALQDEWILDAGNPDPEIARELSERDLTEVVRSAQRKRTSSRRVVDPSVAKSRSNKLHKIAQDFEKGIRHGERLGDTPNEEFMSKPEFLRRKNKLVTAPGLQIRQAVHSLAASAHAKMQAVRKGSFAAKKTSSSRIKFNSVMPAEETPFKAPPSHSFGVGEGDCFEKTGKVGQATSMRGGMMYIGKLHPEEISIFKKTWEEWKQESEHKNAETRLASTSSNPKKQRVTTEECILTVQAEMERAVAQRNPEPHDLSARMPGTVKEVPEESRSDREDLPLPMGLPHRLFVDDDPAPMDNVVSSQQTSRGVTPQNGLHGVECAQSSLEGSESSQWRHSTGRKQSTGSRKSRPMAESLIQKA